MGLRERWMPLRRATTYLLSTLATAMVTGLAWPLLCHPRLGRAWASWHRDRADRLLPEPVTPHPPERGYRYLAWLLVQPVTGVSAGLVTVLCVGNLVVAAIAIPLWWAFPADDPPRLFVDVPVTGWGVALTLGGLQLVILSALAVWTLPLLAAGHARLSRAVLTPSPTEELAHRVSVLTQTRADVLDAHGAELRRIERDLHDGTQARLVNIAIRLAVAREALPDNPHIVAELLQDAHESTEQAMTELRSVIRGIYPPILADRGLSGALTAMASRANLPTEVDLGDLGPIPAAIEVVTYFAVTEALTNVAKHSRATRIRVRVHRIAERLSITITDDGIGDADESRGTGLAGIRRRALALDGTLTVTSPVGGPTVVLVELPCG